MFSGKSLALIDAYEKAQKEGQEVLAIKSAIDTRYHKRQIVSHSLKTIPALPLHSLQELSHCSAELILIDEIQFFNNNDADILFSLLSQGKTIIVAGLNLDFRGRAFPVMKRLMAEATEHKEMHARCALCEAPAAYSHRLVAGEETVMVGGESKYEPRCKNHFEYASWAG